MSMTSTFFLFLFFPMTLAGYYLIRKDLRNCFLVAASLLFYMLCDFDYILLLLLSILVNYLMGILIDYNLVLAEKRKGDPAGKTYQRTAKFYLVLSIVFNFELLLYYKYFIFAVDTVNTLFRLDFTVPVIGLPIGISFFTFRAVSYCLDIYWRTAPVQKNPLNVALYISFFPQVTMGPITGYKDFAPQLHGRKFEFDIFSEGMKQIVAGLFKKLVLADSIGRMVDYVFAMNHSDRTVVMAWMGIAGYLIQLYYDFSGYSDMAIGLGKLFGFQTPKNFEYPYAAKSVVDYWGRWHITLGTWLKGYIYTPVFRSMMQGKHSPLFVCDIIALLATWMFSGLWHGAAWHFVCWGLYQFAFIALERTIENYQKKRRKRLKLKKQPETRRHAVLAHIYLIVVVIFGQIMFRVNGFWNYFPYVGSMFGLLGNPVINNLTVFYWKQNAPLFIVGGIFCFPIACKLENFSDKHYTLQCIRTLIQPVIYAAMALISIAFVFTSTYQAFIYFQF